MRIVIESLLAVVAFFAVLAAINYNEKYADMVAKSQGFGWCEIQFNDSKADIPCERVSRLD